MSCGTIEHDGQVTHVIAAGGTASHKNYVKTVFVYNVEENTWSTGPT